MTVEYMGEKHKAPYIEKYPFLKEFAENKKIIYICTTPCRALPLMENSFEQHANDVYETTWHEFKDDKNVYRLKDLYFEADYDTFVAGMDHELTLYVKDNALKPILVALSGPFGVGKRPIIEWLKKLYFPWMRDGRGTRELCQVNALRQNFGMDLPLEGNFHKFWGGGAVQAINLDELDREVERHDAVLLGAYPGVLDFLKDRYKDKVDFASVFISPLSKGDIMELTKQGGNIDSYLPDLMLDSLIRWPERREGAHPRSGQGT